MVELAGLTVVVRRADGNVQLPTKLTFDLMITRWASILNPVLANPTTNMSILKNVNLVTGTNQIAHLLGQMQQGWVITDIQGSSTIYRNKPFNSTYLYLSSSGAVTIDIGVF